MREGGVCEGWVVCGSLSEGGVGGGGVCLSKVVCLWSGGVFVGGREEGEAREGGREVFVGGGGGGEKGCGEERRRCVCGEGEGFFLVREEELFVGGRAVFVGGFVNSTPHFARITLAIFSRAWLKLKRSVCCLRNSHRPARMSCSARCLTRHFFLIH